MSRLRAGLGGLLIAGLLLAGCDDTDEDPAPSDERSRAERGSGQEPTGGPPSGSPEASGSHSTGAPPDAPPDEMPSASQSDAWPRVRPADLDAAVAMRAVRHLAGEIGPRHATSPAFRRAADWVTGRFERYGLSVTRQRVHTPAGDSWGTPVEAGTSYNLVATPPDFEPTQPHLVVGAHLDTIPVAPGAEDNASGVGVLLAVAEALQERRTRLPVVLIAFGAEEPRGPTDADHHYGSRAYVARLTQPQRRAVRGMLALDRVGVGTVVPVCSAFDDEANRSWRAAGVAAAERAGVPRQACVNSSSDHTSFARRGLPGIRLGSTPYAGYHSPADVPSVIDPAQLGRSGRVALAWLAGERGSAGE